MIVKGASRSGPQQLAAYLMRVGRYDTGEPTQLLDLQSIRSIGVDANDRQRTAAELSETFRDWQSSVEATQRGRDGLYHCEISPEARYARDMTKKDWLRLADIAGNELGFDGQRRAVVLHAGKDGRPHLHVVWERTDLEKMKVISDAYNYIGHERASYRMEKEFGHEFIPGKHAKRDRKKQPEFPRQKLTQDEDQFQKRTGLSKEQRIEQVKALHAAADNGPAFKAALEDAGYLLAKGDRGYVVVDQKGGHSVLSRNVGLKKKEIEAFMAGVEFDKLPTVEEAKAIQFERRHTVSKSDVSKSDGPADLSAETSAKVEDQKQGVEASKFLRPDAPAKAPEPTPVPPQPQILPEKPETTQVWTQKELTPQFPALQPPPPPPEPPSLDPEIEKLRAAVLKRQTQEYRAFADKNAADYRALQAQLKNSMPAKMEDFTIQQEAAFQAFKREQNPKRKGLKGLLDKFRDHIDPEAAAERKENLKQDLQRFRLSQREQRKDFIKQLRADNKAALDALRTRHLDEQKRRDKSHDEELGRYLRDRQRAIDIAREQSEWAKDFQKEQEYRDGEEPPPPKLGK